MRPLAIRLPPTATEHSQRMMTSYYSETVNDETVKKMSSKKGMSDSGAVPDDTSDAVLHMDDVGHTAVNVDSFTVCVGLHCLFLRRFGVSALCRCCQEGARPLDAVVAMERSRS